MLLTSNSAEGALLKEKYDVCRLLPSLSRTAAARAQWSSLRERTRQWLPVLARYAHIAQFGCARVEPGSFHLMPCLEALELLLVQLERCREADALLELWAGCLGRAQRFKQERRLITCCVLVQIQLYPVIPVAKEKLVDTNGAGDAFVGGMPSAPAGDAA